MELYLRMMRFIDWMYIVLRWMKMRRFYYLILYLELLILRIIFMRLYLINLFYYMIYNIMG